MSKADGSSASVQKRASLPDNAVAKPLPREKLPAELQKIVDADDSNDDSLFDRIYEGTYVCVSPPSFLLIVASLALPTYHLPTAP